VLVWSLSPRPVHFGSPCNTREPSKDPTNAEVMRTITAFVRTEARRRFPVDHLSRSLAPSTLCSTFEPSNRSPLHVRQCAHGQISAGTWSSHGPAGMPWGGSGDPYTDDNEREFRAKPQATSLRARAAIPVLFDLGFSRQFVLKSEMRWDIF
jgi:hypothetical protein